MKKNGKAAAFYDLEGTLVSTNLVHTLGFYAKRQQGLWQTAKKSIGTLAKLPFFGVTDLYSRNVLTKSSSAATKALSGSPPILLGRAVREVLKPAFFRVRPSLLPRARRSANASGINRCLGFHDQRLVDHLGIDDFCANRLEFVNGYATGRVLPPVMASATKAKWIREYAEREDINLSESYAYSDSISDPMLSIVGHLSRES